MSGNKKNSNSKEGGGPGLGTAVLLGGAAAAMGFLARDLWNSYQEFQAETSSSGNTGPRPPPSNRPPNATSDWEEKSDKDKKLGARKKQREAFRGENHIPDEMKCVVCLDNPREICLIPCGHVCLCEDCAEKIETKCPMCQQKFKSMKAIYI